MMKPARFRKKPEAVEAMQYTRNGLQAEACAKWCGGVQTDEGLEVPTSDGPMIVGYGDWVVRYLDGSLNGEFDRIPNGDDHLAAPYEYELAE